ncbi:hypothetical protein LINPERPRIM_LOCUS42467 [Linum perenne]
MPVRRTEKLHFLLAMCSLRIGNLGCDLWSQKLWNICRLGSEYMCSSKTRQDLGLG